MLGNGGVVWVCCRDWVVGVGGDMDRDWVLGVDRELTVGNAEVGVGMGCGDGIGVGE